MDMLKELLVNTLSFVAAATVAIKVSVVLFFLMYKDHDSAEPAVPE